MVAVITDEEAQKILSTIKIPARPEVLVELEREKSKDDPDLRKIAQIVSKDIALTAALLKAVNSPFFGLSRKVDNVLQAAMTLGLANVISIVTGIAVKNSVSGKNMKLERFWDSAEKVANIAAYLADKVPGISREHAFMFGLFRDCGIPLMLQKYPDYTDTLKLADSKSKLDFTSLEDSNHATNHATLGYLLAKSWGLPSSLCQALLNHHDISVINSDDPISADSRGLMAIIRFAEFLSDFRQMRSDEDWEKFGPEVLSYLGISEDELNDIKEEILQYT